MNTIVINPHVYSTAAVNPVDGLVAWYKCDEGSGTTLTDSVDGTYNGQCTGSMAWDSGNKVVGTNAIIADGSDDRINLPTNITIGTTCTIAAWVYPNSAADNYGCVLSSPTRGLYVMKSLYVNLYYGSGHLSSTTIPDQQWTHIMVTCNSGNVTFYINNVTAGTATSWPGMSAANIIWNGAAGEKYKGNLDDLRIYNKVLSQAERSQLYAYR